jgi:hypothetical protein
MCPAYVAVLIGPGDRKIIQPMASRDNGVSYDLLHHFIGSGVWGAASLEAELLAEADKPVGGKHSPSAGMPHHVASSPMIIRAILLPRETAATCADGVRAIASARLKPSCCRGFAGRESHDPTRRSGATGASLLKLGRLISTWGETRARSLRRCPRSM